MIRVFSLTHSTQKHFSFIETFIRDFICALTTRSSFTRAKGARKQDLPFFNAVFSFCTSKLQMRLLWIPINSLYLLFHFGAWHLSIKRFGYKQSSWMLSIFCGLWKWLHRNLMKHLGRNAMAEITHRKTRVSSNFVASPLSSIFTLLIITWMKLPFYFGLLSIICRNLSIFYTFNLIHPKELYWLFLQFLLWECFFPFYRIELLDIWSMCSFMFVHHEALNRTDCTNVGKLVR